MSSNSVINIPGTNTSLSGHKIAQILVITTIIALFINALIFTYYNANPLVRSDDWRYISIYLRPWYSGELHWFDLWKDHHPLPLTAISFIINASYFDLRMDYEALFSVSFSLLSLLVIWHIYNSVMETKVSSPEKYIFIALTASLLFSLTSSVIYTWPLVTQGYIFVFFMLLTLMSIDHLSRKNIDFYRFTLNTLYITLLFLAFSDAAKILIYSCLVVTFLSFLIDRDLKWLPPILSIVLAIILQFSFLHIIDYDTPYSEMSIMSSAAEKIQYLPEYFLYIGTGLLGAWVNIGMLVKKTGVSHVAIYSISSMIFMTYIYTLFLYFKNRMYSKSIIPGTLVVASILTGIGAAIFRFNPDTQSAITGSIPRYYLHYALGAIGVIWIWCMHLKNIDIKMRIRIASYSIIFIILISQIFSSITAWQSTPYIKKIYINYFNLMLANADGDDLSIKPAKFMVGGNYPEPYLSGLSLLKEHNINAFSDKNIIKKFQE